MARWITSSNRSQLLLVFQMTVFSCQIAIEAEACVAISVRRFEITFIRYIAIIKMRSKSQLSIDIHFQYPIWQSSCGKGKKIQLCGRRSFEFNRFEMKMPNKSAVFFIRSFAAMADCVAGWVPNQELSNQLMKIFCCFESNWCWTMSDWTILCLDQTKRKKKLKKKRNEIKCFRSLLAVSVSGWITWSQTILVFAIRQFYCHFGP